MSYFDLRHFWRIWKYAFSRWVPLVILYRGENGTAVKYIDSPDPVGKTPITFWPFRIDSKDFTSKWFKIKRWKVAVT